MAFVLRMSMFLTFDRGHYAFLYFGRCFHRMKTFRKDNIKVQLKLQVFYTTVSRFDERTGFTIHTG